MEDKEKADQGNIPSSWNYGSFHFQSRLYTSFMQKDINQSAMMKRKYEPLNVTNMGVDPNVKYKPPPKETAKAKDRRASKIEKCKNNLKIDQLKPRKVFTSTG